MKEPRRLALKREALADLTPRDLAAVHGAALDVTVSACVLDESFRVCSLRCQMTFNTCEVAG